MSAAEWLAVLVVSVGLLLGLPLLRALALRFGVAPEVARKSVHVVMGLVCVAFPWIFGRSLPVWVLATLVTVLLGLLRIIPRLKSGLGSALHGVLRLSYGEVLFAPAVASVFQLARGDAYLHAIPIGILTIADAAGGLAGTRWGQQKYGCGDGSKTVLGSTVFLVAAFLCTLLPLVLGGRTDLNHALWIGLTLATLGMMAEGIADRGFDNLVIPLLSYFVLQRLLVLEFPALAGLFFAAACLLFLVLCASPWSTLNGGALLGSALLGCACAVVADWRFVLPPMAVFLSHLRSTHRYRLAGVYDHRLDVVIAHAIGCLPWVFLAQRGWLATPTCLAGISFAMGAQLAFLDTVTRLRIVTLECNPLRSTLKGWGVAAVPGLVWLWPDGRQLLVPVALAMAATYLVALFLQATHGPLHGRERDLRLLTGVLALLGSCSALFYQP